MVVTREFTVFLDDRPGTLGKFCRALADFNLNILALHSFPIGGKNVTRFIVDNPLAVKTVLDRRQLLWTESQVVQLKLPHRPGEIARVASQLGEANIQIDYVYSGAEPGTNSPLVFFAVAELNKATSLLEQLTSAGATR